MNPITLRPVQPERDFEQIAALFSIEQDEPSTADAIAKDYAENKDRILRLTAAEDAAGQLTGFHWLSRGRLNPENTYLYLIVQPERRGQGIGARLYADLEQAARDAQVEKLVVSVRDDCPACRAFADARGFTEKSHTIGMTLHLADFDDRPYDDTVRMLEAQGFAFTTMEALGNTEAAQRKLFQLNNTAAMQTPGTDGTPSWLSFEDFQKSVCQSDWYIPAAQMVVIDTASGDWAAMSAITRFQGVDYAYNLFTGVDSRYRGRKLAQAVKCLALRYARDVLQVRTVQTHHNAKNEPMIAIDRKFGYTQTPGSYQMEKPLKTTA